MSDTPELAHWVAAGGWENLTTYGRDQLKKVATELRRLAAVEQELAELKKLSVTNILLDITPGDGSGFEVYAKSVKDVEDMLTKLGSELEDFQLGIKKPFEVEKKLQELAELKAAMGEPVAITPVSQAMQMYAKHPTYQGTRALSWLEAPQRVVTKGQVMTASVEEIQKIAGIHPAREVCPFKCPDAANRKPCHCYPGYSTDAAVRLYRTFEKHFTEAK